ncbi:MAG: hypothetical protein QOG85_23 [Gaiellaceae bacterium]|nr:hypothetical protein [Gaiellaceae bacterium]
MPKALPLDLLNSATPPVQDFIILQGRRSPGRATITNAGSPRTWDKQKGWGMSGATLIYTGDDLSDFDVIIDIWEKSHWGEWNDFARVLEKRSSGLGAKFLEISHPVLYRAPLRISQVAIRDVTQFEQSKTGLWTCRILMTAWNSPLPALGKPDGTIPGVTGGGITDLDNDPEAQALLAKQRGLGGVL